MKTLEKCNNFHTRDDEWKDDRRKDAPHRAIAGSVRTVC